MKRVCKKFPRLSPPHSPAKPSKQPKKGALARLAEPCGPSDSPFKPERSRRGRPPSPLTERAVHLADTWRPARADLGNLSPLPSPPVSGKSSLSPFPGQTDSSASLLSPHIRRPPRPFQRFQPSPAGRTPAKQFQALARPAAPAALSPLGGVAPPPSKAACLPPWPAAPPARAAARGRRLFCTAFCSRDKVKADGQLNRLGGGGSAVG